MITRNLSEVKMESFKFGKPDDGFHTKFVFFFKEGGTKYYIDKISNGLGYITIRNSKTGITRIILIESELETGRYKDTYYFTDHE